MTSGFAHVSIKRILFGRKRKTEILVGLETIAHGAASIASSLSLVDYRTNEI